MKGFLQFVREQGVVGLAVGFVLGTAVAKVVSALVTDIISPLIGLMLGRVNLQDKALNVGSVHLMWGDFISAVIDFIVIALVIYFGVKWLGLEKLGTKKEEKK